MANKLITLVKNYVCSPKGWNVFPSLSLILRTPILFPIRPEWKQQIETPATVTDT